MKDPIMKERIRQLFSRFEETAFSSPETLEEFYLKEIAKMQSKIKPEVFRIKPTVKKS